MFSSVSVAKDDHKTFWRDLCQEKNPLHFGAALPRGTDPGFIFNFSQFLREQFMDLDGKNQTDIYELVWFGADLNINQYLVKTWVS